MNWKALTMTAMLVVATGAGVAPVSATQQSSNVTAQQGSASAQSGAFVSFETTDDAVVDYSVNGETVVENVTVQAASESQSDTGLGGDVDLGADVGFEAAGLDLASSLSASGAAEITTESGATIAAHDNQRGELVVHSGGESQVAQLNVSSSSAAETAGDQRAVITTDDGTQAVVIATGNGSVAVTDDGDVRARTGSDGEVVYRQYSGDRSDSEQSQERMIANGTATASVYVQQTADAGESGSDDAQERTTNVVQYGEDTTVDVTQQTATRVNATVERARSEGRVVIVTVADEAFESTENAEVFVDGEAAVEADSYSEVQSAADGGDQSAFLVEQSTSAEATTDVVVGINHFSARDLSLVSDDTADGSDDASGDDSTTTTDDGAGSGDATTASGDGSSNDAADTGTTAGTGPGFGVTVALAALAALGLLAVRRD